MEIAKIQIKALRPFIVNRSTDPILRIDEGQVLLKGQCPLEAVPFIRENLNWSAFAVEVVESSGEAEEAKTEPDKEPEDKNPKESDLIYLPGVGPDIAAALGNVGIASQHQLMAILMTSRTEDIARLVSIPGITENKLAKWLELMEG